jgi:hypothetical protein
MPGDHRWPDIVWRAWCNTDDEDMARQLFPLVADEPVSWQGTAGMMLWGAVNGMAFGLLVYLIAIQVWEPGVVVRAGMLSLAAWIGGGVGAVIALLVQIIWYQQSTWRQWLGLLTPNITLPPLPQRLGGLCQAFSGEQAAVLVGGLVGGLFGGPLGGILGACIVDIFIQRSKGEAVASLREGFDRPRIWAFGLIGGLGGWLLSVGGILLVGILRGVGLWPGLTGLAVFLVVVLVVGQVAILFLGVDLGMLGGTVFGLVGGLFSGMLMVVVSGSAGGWIAGLTVLLVNSLAGVVRVSPHAWYWRRLWFWWREAPLAARLEGALRRACVESLRARDIWTEVLRNLAAHRVQLGPAEAYITWLESSDWRERFFARHLLVSLEGEVVPTLQSMAENDGSPNQETALWLLQSIATATVDRLEEKVDRWLCPQCAVYYGPVPLQFKGESWLTYYGCRNCGQSRHYREWTDPVVAVLDVRMSQEMVEHEGALWVNWLLKRSLFDFDRVEIVCVMDEEVERFAMQIAKDADAVRLPRYERMLCRVAANCGLSENTFLILRDLFGQVVVTA